MNTINFITTLFSVIAVFLGNLGTINSLLTLFGFSKVGEK